MARWFGPVAGGTVIVALVATLAVPAPATGQSGAVPEPPPRPVVDAFGHDFVTLSWDDPGDATITGYQILRRNRDADALGDFTIIEDDTASTDTVYTDHSAEPATRYGYRIKARNAHGLSERSRAARVETLPEPATEVPAEPALSSLSLGGLVLSPEFDPEVISYSAPAPAGTVQVTVDAQPQDPSSAVQIIPADADANTGGHQVELEAGTPTTVTVTVTASDSTTASYVVVVEAEADGSSDPDAEARAAATNLRNLTYFPREQTASGTLDGPHGSVHYYRFRVDLSMIVELHLRNQDADADLVLEDADGVVVAEARSSGTADESISGRLEPGRYYVRVEAQESGTNSYELGYEAVQNTHDLDLGDATDRMWRGLLYSYVAADIGGRDPVDYFRFSLREPRTLHLVMWRLEGDLDLFVEDRHGTVLRASRTSGTADESLEVTLASGTWYIVVRPQQAGSNLSYVTSYGVSMPAGTQPATGPDDYADEASGGAPLPVDATVRGKIDTAQDEDWFSADLEEGHTYQIDLDGPALPYVHEVRDSAGNIISEETDSGDGSNGSQSPPQAPREPQSRESKDIAGITGVNDSSKSPDGRTAGWGPVYAEAPTVDEGDQLQRSAPPGNPPGDGAGADSMSFGDGWAQITPKETATYYLSTRSNKGTGDYEVSLRQVVDDYAADTTTTGAVTVGGSSTGTIEQAGDNDWFEVVFETGKAYLIDLMGAQTSDGTLRDPFLAGIHDSSGRRVSGTTDDNSGLGTNSRVRFAPTSNGIYYVAARGTGNRIGTYTLAVTQQPDDFPSGTGTTGAVAVGGTAQGEIEAEGDHDWFGVTLEAGKTYRFDVMGKQLFQADNGTLQNPYLDSIYRADGTRVPGTHINDYGSYFDARIDYTPTVAGTYYLSAGGYGEGTYTVAVTDVTSGAPDDYAADTTTTGTIDVGGTATGEVEFYRDDDWFRVTLQANRTYYIDLMALHLGKGTLDWPGLFGIHDSSGTLIPGTTDDSAHNGPSTSARVVFTPPTTGVYYVAAGSVRYIVRLGTYTLRLTDMTRNQADDHPATTDSTATVGVDGSVVARNEQAGDHDWYKVSLTANKVYRFDLMGAWSGDGTLDDPVLHGIRHADGTLIAGTDDDNSGVYTNSRLFYEPSTTGNYFVDAGGPGAGTYTLAVTNITDSHPDDYDDSTTGTTGSLDVGGSAIGDIGHPGDRDWFAVTLEAGTQYQFDLKGGPTGDGLPGFGTLNDPFLHGIHNSSGTRIAGTSDDDGGVHNYSRVRYRPAQGGTYYVSAGGDSGTYTLFAASLGSDDHPAGTTTTATVTVGGSATGEIEREGDRDWFSVTLVAGTAYRIELNGARTRDGTLRDPYLSIPRGPSGPFPDPPADDSSGIGSNSLITFTPTTNGVHYLSAGAERDFTGSYTLYVTEAR